MDNATRICQLDGCENPITSAYKAAHGCSREHGRRVTQLRWGAKVRAQGVIDRAKRAEAIANGDIPIKYIEKVCRNEECGKAFKHTNPNKKYCTRECSTRRCHRLRREENRAHSREYYRQNKAAISAKKREYDIRNADALREWRQAYYLANKEAAVQSVRDWRKANPEKRREYNRKRRAQKRATASQLNYTTEQIEAKIAYWGWKCWMCGGDWVAIDHVKPLSKGGPHILANMRPACRRCNGQKHAKWNGVSGLRAHLNVPSDIKRAG